MNCRTGEQTVRADHEIGVALDAVREVIRH
jgi:hypothetical protein